jgi:hypothetical protein
LFSFKQWPKEGKAMGKRSYIRFCLISIMAFMISLPIWASAEEVGNFTKIEERVDYQKGATGPLTPAKVKEPVEVNDIIQTYDVSRAQVEFRDKTLITISPKSKVAIESYMFDPSKFERTGKFDLIQGVMKVVVPVSEAGQKRNITIKTSTAIMGIRGTEFIAISATNASIVYVTSGRVCFKRDRKTGKYSVRPDTPGVPIDEDEVCVDAGFMSVILQDQMPSSPTLVTAEVMAAAQALLTSGINDVPGTCSVGTLPGVDLEAVANDLISRGADQQSVKDSLGAVCYVTFSYSPPAAAPAAAPSTPGGGGGITGTEEITSPSS